MEDWRGETRGRGVDYVAKLPGCESPVEWYGQFPQLVAARDKHAEERGQIDMMIALDKWGCLSVKLADSWEGLDAMEDTRLLVQTQFGKRLILMSAIDAHEYIPPEADDEEYEEPGS